MTEEPISEASNNRTLITYSVLTGLTPLIPVPLVDDLAKSYFRRRLVRALAAAHDSNVSDDVIKALASEERGGCAGGCLVQIVFYPLKKIFRKIFYFLEWKRAADLTSYTYHYGYLVNYALREGIVTPGEAPGGEQIRAAIERACREAPIKPVETAIVTTFRQSKSALFSAAKMIEKSVRHLAGKAEPKDIEQNIESIEEEEKREVKGIVERLQQKIGEIPESHFDDLRARFRTHLEGEGLPPGGR